jgi:hypothetical protein
MNEPRPVDLLVTIVFLFLGGLALAFGWTVPGWICMAIAVSAALWIPAVSIYYARADLMRAQADLIRNYSAADPQARDMLGIKYPTLRVRLNGDARVFVDTSDVELKWFRRFMLDSTTVYISAEGHWNDKTIARQQWFAWKRYLDQEKAIYANSQSGNRTWKWRPGFYWRFYSYVTMRPPADLVPDEVITPIGAEPLPDWPVEKDIERQFEP